MGIGTGLNNGLTYQFLRPAYSRPKSHGVSIGKQFQHCAILYRQRLSNQRNTFIDQRRNFSSHKRLLTQLSKDTLLADMGSEFCLCLLGECNINHQTTTLVSLTLVISNDISAIAQPDYPIIRR